MRGLPITRPSAAKAIRRVACQTSLPDGAAGRQQAAIAFGTSVGAFDRVWGGWAVRRQRERHRVLARQRRKAGVGGVRRLGVEAADARTVCVRIVARRPRRARLEDRVGRPDLVGMLRVRRVVQGSAARENRRKRQRACGAKLHLSSEAMRIFTILSGAVTEPLSDFEPLLDLVDDIHAGHDVADNCVLAVKEAGIAEADEELRIGRIRAPASAPCRLCRA